MTAEETRAEEVLELVRLLVGCDRDRLLAALSRLEDRRLFAEHLSTVLGDAMRLGASRDERLGEALAPLVSKGVHETVQRDPARFGKALAPAMGPAIRQSVLEMFRSLFDNFERTLEQSLTPHGWKWRLEAWRTGKPFAEVVFLHTLAYRVEHVFLIGRDGGLLMQHVSAGNVKAREGDLISAMLTAIQDFVTDAFEAPVGDTLGAFQVGELNVWVEQTDDLVLAAVIRGQAPKALRADLREALEHVQLECAAQIDSFEGDVADLDVARPILERCLVERELEDKASRSKPKRRKVLRIGVAVIAIAALGWWWYTDFDDASRWRAYVRDLHAEPGVAVTFSERSGGKYHLAGLRDPLAVEPAALAVHHGIDAELVVSRWEPYHALHDDFVMRRVAAVLPAPDGVSMTLTDGVMRVSGRASHVWIERFGARAPAVPGIDSVDVAAVVDVDLENFDAALSEVRAITVPVQRGSPPYIRTAAAVLTVRLRTLMDLAAPLDRGLSLRCWAHTSATASAAAAEPANVRRAAEAVRDRLREAVGFLPFSFGGISEGPQAQGSTTGVTLLFDVEVDDR